MIRISRLILLFLLLVTPTLLRADTVAKDFDNAHQGFFQLLRPEWSNLQFDYVYQPKNEDDGGRDGEFDLHHFMASLDLPVPITESLFYRVGGVYEGRFNKFKNLSPAVLSDSSLNLHKLELDFGLGYFFTSDTMLVGDLRPGVYSDFDGGLSSDAFNLYGDVLLAYRANPGTQLVVGLVRSEDFDDLPVYPIIGIRLLSENGLVHFNLTLPVKTRLAYNMSSRSQLYVGAWIRGDKYSVKAGPDKKDTDLQVQDQRAGLGFHYWITQNTSIAAELGFTFGGQFELKSGVPDPFGEEMKSTGYGRLRFGVAF